MKRWFVVAAMLLAGCGGVQSGPERVIVSGKVTYQGAPIENGDILFTPAAGSSNPASGAIIENGNYLANNKGGVPIGKFLVKISGFRPSGQPVPEGDIQPMDQYIPAKYNDRTSLEIEITKDAEGTQQNFDLE
ncbi:hypothetical protein M4951_10180 [Blastopirellula sp. J2-11]|uniref:hypothetical protein n=1 Tax=Blastopirellula sp. J2-11 TaxID=2943192 RepID=UPI0021C72AC0|nr:hypothetical protein [Blastopirellula sp. J2-11]UUO08665.1 hypothetical protein M4951_10180 [Blastopirellula sp. J2-11]